MASSALCGSSCISWTLVDSKTATKTHTTLYSDEESDDEDDDEAELQAELAKIKEEREAAAAKKALEEQELELRANRENAMRNNPLALIEENSAKVTHNMLWCFHWFVLVHFVLC